MTYAHLQNSLLCSPSRCCPPFYLLQRLGADALAHLEHKLVTYGKSNLLELVQVGGAGARAPWAGCLRCALPRRWWPAASASPCAHPRFVASLFCPPSLPQAVESWEHRVVSFTGSQLGALEDRLSAIGRHNLQELLQLSDAVRAAGQTGWQELSGVGEKIRWAWAGQKRRQVQGRCARQHLPYSGVRCGAGHAAEPPCIAIARPPCASTALSLHSCSTPPCTRLRSAEISNLESAVQSALATALEAKWPVSRWPIYVFTGGWVGKGVGAMLWAEAEAVVLEGSRSAGYMRRCWAPFLWSH